MKNSAEQWFKASYMNYMLGTNKGYELAIKFADKALELNPQNGKAWALKSIALFHLSKVEEAIKCYEKKLEIDPISEEEFALEIKQFLDTKKEETSITIKNLEQIIKDAKSIGLSTDESLLLKAKASFDNKNYLETLKFCKNLTQELESYKPSITINLSNTIFNLNTGRRTKLVFKNEGGMAALSIDVKLIGDMDIRTFSEVKLLKPGDVQGVDVWIRPKAKGETPLDISLRYIDALDRSYEEKKELWINTDEAIPSSEKAVSNDIMIAEQKSSQHPINSTPSTGLSSYLSLDRTIFEPVKQDFIISTQRPLPNVKNWIEKSDPSMYWLILCINNNSDKSIDEWGIELETPTTLRILDARIEGIEHGFKVRESFSKAWLTNWILGVPHHLGVVIPRKGSKRIYFKLGSDACGVSYSIKGKVSTSDCEIPIKEKHFKYSCDTATLKVAIRTNPEEAEKYAETVLSNSYSKDTALKLLHSFRIVQEIDRCCARGNYGEIKDKLQLLLGALEGAKAGERLIRMTRDNLESVSIMGEADASAQRAGRLCGNLVDAWINEVLRM